VEPVVHSIVFGYGFRARSGKDSAVATILAERGHLYDIRRYSFASELKSEVNQAALACGGMEHLFSRPQEYVQENGNFLELPEWVVYDPDPPMDDPECGLGKQRLLLQWYGSEFRRAANPAYWVDRVASRIAKEKPEIALLSDVRFPNEMLWAQKYGEVIRIDRPSVKSPNAHVSEEALSSIPDDCWSDIIMNTGSLEEFRKRVLFSFDMLISSHPALRPA